MEVFCLEDVAFYTLIKRVSQRIKLKPSAKPDKWISGDDTMKMFRISSKTMLKKLRDEGKIRFTKSEKKIVLYDTDSIIE
jgi:hypothetical protein